jgi:flagellar basal-body rod protein FlgB
MPISDIPILSMLRQRMQWHQARQQVLAENVANADTPNYQRKDIAPPTFERELSVASVQLATTDPGHISDGTSSITFDDSDGYQPTARGNLVNHEDEMTQIANNQMDFEAAASMYTHSLTLIKLANDRG